MVRTRVEITGASEVRRFMFRADVRLKGSKKPVMEPIAKRLADRILRNIDAGGVNNLPLSPVTLRIRETRKDKPTSSSTAPLVDIGKMRSRVKSFATDNSAHALADTFYAGFQHIGFTTSPKSAVPNRKVPGRPFMTLDQGDVDWAMEQLYAFVFGDVDAAA